MLSHTRSTRLKFVVTLCMVLAGGAVSMGTSCITAPKGKGGGGGATTGTINGTIDSASTSGPMGAVTVTATDSATGATAVGTTASSGTYSISDVPAGSGTLILSTLPTGCTVPATINYALNKGGTLTYNIPVNCSITLP